MRGEAWPADESGMQVKRARDGQGDCRGALLAFSEPDTMTKVTSKTYNLSSSPFSVSQLLADIDREMTRQLDAQNRAALARVTGITRMRTREDARDERKVSEKDAHVRAVVL